MSLRIRLCLMVTIMILLAAGFGFGVSILMAMDRVQAELNSTADLTRQLASVINLELGASGTEEQLPEVMSRLERIQSLRHLDVEIISETRTYPEFERNVDGPTGVPQWFVNMVVPQGGIVVYRFLLSNGDEVIISTDPSENVEEVWRETSQVLVSRLAVLLTINLLMFYFISRWIKPSEEIMQVLEAMESDDFSRKVPRLSLPELQNIASKVNHLSDVLGSSKTENDRLAKKALRIQEQERRYLARELHDSLGQSVSAIKAIAVSISQRVMKTDELAAESASRIEDIAHKAYTSVRNMMHDLRPIELDELGVAPAIEQMVDEWNEHHEDTFCRLSIEADFTDLDELQQINLYRIVQEALTNVAKYAEAEYVDVRLGGAELVKLVIEDDGKGFDMISVQRGMGMQNLKDRVQALQGKLNVTSAPSQGVRIEIEFPRQVRKRRRASDRF